MNKARLIIALNINPMWKSYNQMTARERIRYNATFRQFSEWFRHEIQFNEEGC